jgi:hypothetical protein
MFIGHFLVFLPSLPSILLGKTHARPEAARGQAADLPVSPVRLQLVSPPAGREPLPKLQVAVLVPAEADPDQVAVLRAVWTRLATTESHANDVSEVQEQTLADAEARVVKGGGE